MGWECRNRFNEIGYMNVDWIRLAHDWVKWKALIRMVMNLRVPYNVGDFVANLMSGCITRRAVLRVLGVTSHKITTSTHHPKCSLSPFCSRCTLAPSRHFVCLSTAKLQHYELCQGAVVSPDPSPHVKYEWPRCCCTPEHPNTRLPLSCRSEILHWSLRRSASRTLVNVSNLRRWHYNTLWLFAHIMRECAIWLGQS